MRIAGGLSRLLRKIRLVAASDLVLTDKFRYLRDIAIALFSPAARKGSRGYRLRGGASVTLRENSTDEKVFEEVFIQKAYAPYAKAAQQTSPVILIDLGANIGLSVIERRSVCSAEARDGAVASGPDETRATDPSRRYRDTA